MLMCVALHQSQVIAVICNGGEAYNYFGDALLLNLYATRTSFVPEVNLLVHEICRNLKRRRINECMQSIE